MAAHKKDPSTRRRRNVGAGHATLGTAPRARRPRLPQYVPGGEQTKWHPMVLLWWDAIWTSPMAQGYLHVDARGLLRLAVLEHIYWTADTTRERLQVAGEIRLQQQAYGLTPYDRRRLEWTIEVVDEAKQRNQARRAAAGKPTPRADPAVDPRDVLRVV